MQNQEDINESKSKGHLGSRIEQDLRQALSTGSFGANTNKGLSQQLNRMNYLHALSSLRRVITPLADASNNKLTGPRHLHVTQMPILDPVETPEGTKIGIVKQSQ
jgi:DNA-directed RNA polymerase beta subunit